MNPNPNPTPRDLPRPACGPRPPPPPPPPGRACAGPLRRRVARLLGRGRRALRSLAAAQAGRSARSRLLPGGAAAGRGTREGCRVGLGWLGAAASRLGAGWAQRGARWGPACAERVLRAHSTAQCVRVRRRACARAVRSRWRGDGGATSADAPTLRLRERTAGARAPPRAARCVTRRPDRALTARRPPRARRPGHPARVRACGRRSQESGARSWYSPPDSWLLHKAGIFDLDWCAHRTREQAGAARGGRARPAVRARVQRAMGRWAAVALANRQRATRARRAPQVGGAGRGGECVRGGRRQQHIGRRGRLQARWRAAARAEQCAGRPRGARRGRCGARRVGRAAWRSERALCVRLESLPARDGAAAYAPRDDQQEAGGSARRVRMPEAATGSRVRVA